MTRQSEGDARQERIAGVARRVRIVGGARSGGTMRLWPGGSEMDARRGSDTDLVGRRLAVQAARTTKVWSSR